MKENDFEKGSERFRESSKRTRMREQGKESKRKGGGSGKEKARKRGGERARKRQRERERMYTHKSSVWSKYSFDIHMRTCICVKT